MRKKGILVSMIAVAGLASAASAQFFDGFEAYPDGPLFAGGWDGWDGSPAARGVVTSAFAYSGEKSILITGGADAVHPFSGQFTSGLWTMTAWMLLFQNDHTSDTFFIVNNDYTHGGPYTWTIEMRFQASSGMVLDDFRTKNPVNIAYDRWAEIRIEFDLTNNTQTTFYDGQLLSTGTMTRQSGDPLVIANIDLFTLGATSYYDDISIVPAPGAMGLLALGAGAFMRRRRRR
ncbi:MAG: PEP-CTERM sorting domain-containing protein [Phycisphaerae bacterium]